jgi:hypothetical protein
MRLRKANAKISDLLNDNKCPRGLFIAQNKDSEYFPAEFNRTGFGPNSRVELLDIYSLDVYNQDEILDELDIWEVVEN